MYLYWVCNILINKNLYNIKMSNTKKDVTYNINPSSIDHLMVLLKTSDQ
jgi:hypothetical protein